MASYDLVSNVCAGHQTWKIKVRVVRLWTLSAVEEPNKPFAVEMVLIDAEGNKIQASIRKPMMRKFRQAVVEGEVYTMSFFGAIRNTGSYRATMHEYKLLFHNKTRVVPAESINISVFGLSLMSLHDISQIDGSSDFLVDMIGFLTSVSFERVYSRDGKSARMRLLELADYSVKLQCALFGKYVDFINDHLSVACNELPVIIVQFAKVVVQNVMNSTRILWNPHIFESREFRERMVACGFVHKVPIGVIEDGSKRVPVKEEFLDMYPRKTISELHLTEEVVTVLKDDQWWYPSCKYHKAVTPDGGLYYCSVCCTHVDVTPRFKLKVEVYDGEDTAAFVLFDADSSALLNCSCACLVAKAKDLKSNDHPDVFQSLVGMEMLFKVEKGADYAFRFDESFKVKKVCVDGEVIYMFKDDSTIKTPSKCKFLPPFSQLPESAGSNENNDEPGAEVVSLGDDRVTPSCGAF